jgi:cation diffusion facilitator CzcD-associated flavoprotein CzcO
MHTARWDHSYDFKGKRVGVIGNGSSGIQVVPHLQKAVGDEGHLYNFIRGPTWVIPGYLSQLTPDGLGNNFECKPSP